ncbi:VUT family protein [Streptomyces sp. NBC_00557]|uniref:VUT family protein n=1 Tax=Streptomyces sp. NBC_00557 TaxID=2975776 RepID=UPI002E81F5C9|nr:VUT family protein [Streptomyces sp. NBC_00557]WUC37136.1 VUT family protein [Streptomyces sp. NBC_00557]
MGQEGLLGARWRCRNPHRSRKALTRSRPPSRAVRHQPPWTEQLVLRDLARESAGRSAVLAAIAVGTVLSFALASPELAVASAAAFAVAETMDFAVYEPLRKRGLLIAMLASNAVGLLADSLLFLKLAFGSFEYLTGQILGKAWMTLAAIAVLAVLRRRKQATA